MQPIEPKISPIVYASFKIENPKVEEEISFQE